MSTLRIRPATPEDAGSLLAIYAPIVTDTTVSFETVPPGEAEFGQRIATANRDHAWLLAERRGRAAGYAYATRHRAREAYRYSTEVSVYVHPDHRGSGVASALYQQLFETLGELGYYHAYAGITVPNPASMALHRHMGFRRVGTLPRVGFKFGKWRDVSWWHRQLRSGIPSPPS